MKTKVILSVLLLIAGMAMSASDAERAATKRLKVLMIGNSFSICVLNQLPQCAAEAGVTLDIASLYIGGCSLERHWQNVENAGDAEFRPYKLSWNYGSVKEQGQAAVATALDGRKRANIPEVLMADKWDVVTIQQASHKSWDYQNYQPFADNLIAKIRELAPQAEIRIQQTWSYCNADGRICKNDGPGSWGFDQRGMYERLTSAYKQLAAKHGLKIIPTGFAIQLYRERMDRGDVVGSGKDTIHLNREGEYLQACVWLAALFGTDVTQLAYTPEFGDGFNSRAALMRECAQRAVRTFK